MVAIVALDSDLRRGNVRNLYCSEKKRQEYPILPDERTGSVMRLDEDMHHKDSFVM